MGSALLGTLIFATLVGFFTCWPAALVYRFFAGRVPPGAPSDSEPWTVQDVLWVAVCRLATGRFLTWTPRRNVPWTFVDLLIVILLALSLMVGIVGLAQGLRVAPANGPMIQAQQYYLSVIADGAWKMAIIVLAMLYLAVRAGALWRDFGLSRRDLPAQMGIGVVAFVMLAPPVFALQAMIVWFVEWKYEHPLIDMLQKSPDLGLFWLLAISACVIAPLSEEWFFRGLLQGWLERALGRLVRRRTMMNEVGAAAEADTAGHAVPWSVTSESTISSATVSSEATVAATETDVNPYAAPAFAPAPPQPIDDEAPEESFPKSIFAHWLPILASAVLFGVAHWGHGPAPIPLTLLAIGLGYVYQRTHSIVPVMVVHALFNSVSMLLFYVYMFELKQPLP